MSKFIIFIAFNLTFETAWACQDWFDSLKIKDKKNCESICRTSETDMSSFLCPNKCDLFCKRLNKIPIAPDPFYYGLTDAEVSFCEKNKFTCIKAYQLSWSVEKSCLSIYKRSNTDDESDACRHYMWAFVMAQDFGLENSKKILDAHESNPKQSAQEKEMDDFNNDVSLEDFKKTKDKKLSESEILEKFKERISTHKLKVLKPKYSEKGGLP